HFPAVVSNMLGDRAAIPNDNQQRSVSVHIAPASQLAETRQLIGAPTKILTLELEPASLGTITVRMKMSRLNVDLQISVDSVGALHALNNARDKLVEAIQSSGCAVDSCTIQVGPTPTVADSSQYMAGGGGQNMASSGSERASRTDIGQGGAEHGAKNDNPRQEPQDPRSRTPGDAMSPRLADHIHGLYL
ncbi:MAG: flagellar hook-length control protein FliK, partial [Methylocystis sp.]|nr:flagellar hook-length control protein FliK [Methylocystis sp.]